jgi:hypothetical protein
VKLPKLELPGKGKGAAKPVAKASGKRASVKAPPFVENVYRDLRDRHLLIPAIVLLVALIAVPTLLRTEAESAPPVAAPVLPEDATAVEPAVLAEQLGGVRDYRKRLDALKQTNPFDQKFLVPTPKGEAVEDISDSSVVDSVGAGTPGSTSTGSTGGTTSTGATTVDTEPPATTTPPAGDSDDRSNTVYLYDFRVDVVIAHNGKRKKYQKVRPGQLLPDRSTPIAMYLGSPNNLDWGRFLLSSDVTSTEGDGHCAPSANNCEFLKLALDEKRVVEYGPDAEKYSITVTEIRRVLIDKTKRKSE